MLRRTGHSGEAPQPSVLRHATRPVACEEQRTTPCAACDVQHTTLPRGMRRATCGPAQRTAQDVRSGGFSGDVLRRVHERAALLLLDLLSAPASLSREYPEYPCTPSHQVHTQVPTEPRVVGDCPCAPSPQTHSACPDAAFSFPPRKHIFRDAQHTPRASTRHHLCAPPGHATRWPLCLNRAAPSEAKCWIKSQDLRDGSLQPCAPARVAPAACA